MVEIENLWPITDRFILNDKSIIRFWSFFRRFSKINNCLIDGKSFITIIIIVLIVIMNLSTQHRKIEDENTWKLVREIILHVITLGLLVYRLLTILLSSPTFTIFIHINYYHTSTIRQCVVDVFIKFISYYLSIFETNYNLPNEIKIKA